MEALPVIATVSWAYRFVVGDLLLLYRLAWAPIAIYALLPVVIDAVVPSAVPFHQQGISLLHVAGVALILVTTIIDYVLLAAAAVAFHRALLFADRTPRPMAVFALDLPTAYLAVIPIAVQLAGVAIVGIVMLLGFSSSQPLRLSGGAGFLAALAFLATVAVVIWVICRLAPLYPLIVATNRFSLSEAWTLARGNTWRIFGVLLLGNLPLLIALIILSALFALPFAGSIISGDAASLQTAEVLVTAPFTFIVTIPVMAVNAALLCYGFKALVGAPADHVFPPPAEASTE